jgi:hypothetical protein
MNCTINAGESPAPTRSASDTLRPLMSTCWVCLAPIALCVTIEPAIAAPAITIIFNRLVAICIIKSSPLNNLAWLLPFRKAAP